MDCWIIPHSPQTLQDCIFAEAKSGCTNPFDNQPTQYGLTCTTDHEILLSINEISTSIECFLNNSHCCDCKYSAPTGYVIPELFRTV